MMEAQTQGVRGAQRARHGTLRVPCLCTPVPVHLGHELGVTEG